MFIAQKLRNENICGYLLYMWQVEDLIRAYKLDIDRINEQIIKPYPVDEKSKKEYYEWYESLIEMMRMENVQDKGHLQLNKNVIIQLVDFHQLLLKTGIDAGYAAKFYHILPFLTQLRNQQTDSSISDVELCFVFQYGIMLLHLKKTEITAETQKAQTEISKFMTLLNNNYKKYLNGELKLESDEI